MPAYQHPMQEAVAVFQRAFGMPDLRATPRPLPLDRVELRCALIREEGVVELNQAIGMLEGDDVKGLIPTLDALIDTIYVSLGGLVEMGHLVHDLPEEPRHQFRVLIPIDRVFKIAAAAIKETLGDLEVALLDEDVDASVAYTTIDWIGLDPRPFFDEVHRANMSKLGADGKPIHSRGWDLDGYAAGKTLKGPNYLPPDLLGVYHTLINKEG